MLGYNIEGELSCSFRCCICLVSASSCVPFFIQHVPRICVSIFALFPLPSLSLSFSASPLFLGRWTTLGSENGGVLCVFLGWFLCQSKLRYANKFDG